MQATCDSLLFCLSARSIPFTPECLGQYIHGSFQSSSSKSSSVVAVVVVVVVERMNKLSLRCPIYIGFHAAIGENLSLHLLF